MPAGKQLLGSGLLKVLFKKAKQAKESSTLISQLTGNAIKQKSFPKHDKSRKFSGRRYFQYNRQPFRKGPSWQNRQHGGQKQQWGSNPTMKPFHAKKGFQGYVQFVCLSPNPSFPFSQGDYIKSREQHSVPTPPSRLIKFETSFSCNRGKTSQVSHQLAENNTSPMNFVYYSGSQVGVYFHSSSNK